jgi:hypothetical protein
MRQRRKRPEDYPSMTFRLSADDKAWIDRELAELHRKFNSQLNPEEYRIAKGEILVGAIKQGLSRLKRAKAL